MSKMTFYKKTAKIAIPLSLQQLLASAMSIVDTMLVSWIGAVSAVGTASQFDILCSMIAYGAIGGTVMFSAQFYGARDYSKLKKSFGLSIILALINAFFWFFLALFFPKEILSFYMKDPAVVEVAYRFLKIGKYWLIISSLNFAFSYMYRALQQATITLIISIVTMILNIGLNVLLIFGYKSIPAMHVEGSAVGTLIAQSVGLVMYLVHSIKTKQPFIGTFKEMFSLELSFVQPIIKKIMPLIINEAFFGIGTTLFIKAFGELGKANMDGYYIATQIFNVFLFIVYGYGGAISVLLGGTLGEGNIQLAKEEANHHLKISLVISIVLSTTMVVFSKYMVSIFKPESDIVASLASMMVMVYAVKIFIRQFNFIIFSILKSGGDAKIIQFLDAGILWLVGLPVAFISVYIFKMNSLVIVLLLCQLEQLVRFLFGMIRVKQEKWAQQLLS